MCCLRKTDRKITFKQFEEAVGLLAEKKYPGAPNGLAKITALITSSKTGPATHSEAAVRAIHLSHNVRCI